MLDFYEDDDFPEDDFDFEDNDYDDFEEDDDLFSPEDIEAMESLAADFAEGFEDEFDEDAFLGALAGLAAKALPMAMKAAPKLLRAGRSILGKLSRNRTVRSAAKAVPGILRKTAADQLRRYSRGHPVSKNSTLRSAAKYTARAMHPRNRRRIIRVHNKYAHRAKRRYPPGSRVRRVCRCRMVRY